jgi:hypothetical protein
MTGRSPTLFDELHKRIESDLEAARRSFHHPGAKGDASEGVWRGLLQSYLPQRYQVGHVTSVLLDLDYGRPPNNNALGTEIEEFDW